MGTRADFYTGRGSTAKWLGSIAYDGDPTSAPSDVWKAKTEAQYMSALSELAKQDDWTSPEQGWPWPWETSHTTDYAYTWDDNQVLASCGDVWFKPGEEEDAGTGGPTEHPNMKDVQNVTLGARSGVMLFK